MSVTIKLRGQDTVRRNLVRTMGRMQVASMKGLLQAAAFIRRDMDMTPPLIPVDTGVLRASWYVQPSIGPRKNPIVKMGFSAPHAIFAHEIDWQQGKRPGSGPRFFQSALNRNRRKVRQIIANNIVV